MANIGRHLEEWGTGSLGRWYGMVVLIVALLGSTIPLIIGLINAKVDWWWIAIFPILLLIFMFLCFWQYHKIATERDTLKQKEGITFYSHRPEIKVAEDFIKQFDTLYAVFGTGESLESNKLYEPYSSRFKYLILMHPNGQHAKSVKAGYYLNNESELRDKINGVTKHAQAKKIDVWWLDGCLPFSLILGNPLSDNAGAFLEVYVPYYSGAKRPSFIFYKKDYPELFEVLKESYDRLLKDSEEARKL